MQKEDQQKPLQGEIIDWNKYLVKKIRGRLKNLVGDTFDIKHMGLTEDKAMDRNE